MRAVAIEKELSSFLKIQSYTGFLMLNAVLEIYSSSLYTLFSPLHLLFFAIFNFLFFVFFFLLTFSVLSSYICGCVNIQNIHFVWISDYIKWNVRALCAGNSRGREIESKDSRRVSQRVMKFWATLKCHANSIPHFAMQAIWQPRTWIPLMH